MPRRILLVLYAASGAAALVYEVVWTRLLTLQLGHTVAAASTVLAAFMGGLAVGASIAGSFDSLAPSALKSKIALDGASQATSKLRTYAVLELLVAAVALLLPVALT